MEPPACAHGRLEPSLLSAPCVSVSSSAPCRVRASPVGAHVCPVRRPATSMPPYPAAAGGAAPLRQSIPTQLGEGGADRGGRGARGVERRVEAVLRARDSHRQSRCSPKVCWRYRTREAIETRVSLIANQGVCHRVRLLTVCVGATVAAAVAAP